MNFKEWSEKTCFYDFHYYEPAKIAWQACKEEILKILDEETDFMVHGAEREFRKKIEKL